MNVEPWSTVIPGTTGNAVRGIQHLLRAHGYSVVVDGIGGPLTRAAITRFQNDQGIPATGEVEGITWIHLVIVTGLGSHGEAVRGLQSLGLVTSPGQPELVVDGHFGPRTQERVEEFQRNWGLTIDGMAGRETWSFATAVGHAWPLVKLGQNTASNHRVPIAQHLLRYHGATIDADGFYGRLTGEAVRQFQMTLRARYISTTVGQLDWPSLIVPVEPGDTGEHVMAVQSSFPSLATDGIYGPLTRDGIDQLHDVFGGADGIVDEPTWRVLIGPVFD